MILHDSGKQLKFVPIDLLFIASTLYLGGGIYYGFTVLGNVYPGVVFLLLSRMVIRKSYIPFAPQRKV